jgi:arginyl-tRNA synthetase
MEQKIKNIIKEALKNLDIKEVDFIVEHPEDLKNGDYSSNIAMVYAKNLKINPKELAEKIKSELEKNLPQKIEQIEVAGAGFINFYLSRKFFTESVEEIVNKGDNAGKNENLSGKKIMVEYTDPNPFKPFHIGHLMTNAIGESIARILEHSGAVVSRANYQGDVGLHVAKAFYGMQKKGMPTDMSASVSVLAKYIGDSYVLGSEAYENDVNGDEAKKEIDAINKKIYSREDPEINDVYDWGFKVTMEAFEDLYKILGTKFKYYFLESEMADLGSEIVRDNVGKVFEESDGAIVFKAEKYDSKLHTRVFITSKGLPTYETKELGLTTEKFKSEPSMDLCIVITANEQMEYMRVVAKALSLIHPEYENKMMHITHGMMRMTTGKMSSRKGNVITGESLLSDARDAILEKMTDRDFSPTEQEKIATDVGVSALKYSILKQSTGGDIIYDFESAVSAEGDSGPYLQYSFARANSILEKAKKENILPDFAVVPDETFEVEKLLYKLPEIVERSASEYEPHYIANYLIEVARSFNSFYGNMVIVNKEDKTSPYKIALTYAFSFVMKTGLHLLGIEAPEKM